MVIRFLLPGKSREKFLQSGYDEYLKRMSRYAKVSLVTLPEEPLPSNPSSEQINQALAKEAKHYLPLIKKDETLILLDVRAKEVDSNQLASKLSQLKQRSGNFVFLLGSSYGLDDSIRQKADFSFSLSQLTFTHYLALLLLMEQVYRSLKIINGETYDK